MGIDRDDMIRALNEFSLATVAGEERVEGKLITGVPGFLIGSMAATVVTDGRILTQRLKNSLKPKGDVIVVDRSTIATVKVRNFAVFSDRNFDGDWREAVLTRGMSGAFVVELATESGPALRLDVTFGEDGLIGRIGAGPMQIEGAAALLRALRLVERAG